MNCAPRIRMRGRQEYEKIWREMQSFVDSREKDSRDEIWFVEHPPVFTLGQNAKPGHVLAAGDIPVVRVDRGGEVTYHGPGQLVIYPLIRLARLKLGVRGLVCALENAVVGLCALYGASAAGRRDAPGVYVESAKVASIGLRIRKGWSYHGMAINVAMDMEPFGRINPCGDAALAMTQLSALGGPTVCRETAAQLLPLLLRNLGYNDALIDARLPAQETP